MPIFLQFSCILMTAGLAGKRPRRHLLAATKPAGALALIVFQLSAHRHGVCQQTPFAWLSK
jgi:hypothetical protein